MTPAPPAPECRADGAIMLEFGEHYNTLCFFNIYITLTLHDFGIFFIVIFGSASTDSVSHSPSSEYILLHWNATKRP